ncbi:MAG: enoyl-CoA hydratase/isomerase family protein [Proteobacteria bacterium]|nr:enoyl-CoA hydratase/isomerase family protein [Pseudomonadota bacterium]
MYQVGNTGASVVFQEFKLSGGGVLAQAQLNAQATLNSLSLEMIGLLQEALDGWRQREEIRCVLLSGTGRAFCAGGDIQALYRAMVKNHSAGEIRDHYPDHFFEAEYRLDYAIHSFPKTVVCLGHGIVMGGGLGLFSAANVRIVTEKSRIGMPEITIGLFPDAGATHLLASMPRHHAVFLALTGAPQNASDALLTGTATHAIASSDIDGVVAKLCELKLTGHTDQDQLLIEGTFKPLSRSDLPAGELVKVPEHLDVGAEITQTALSLHNLMGSSDWIDKGLRNFANGATSSAGVIQEQLRRCRDLNLADSFRMEMTVASHCGRNTDFAEGIRALLIDKDQAPIWRYPTLADLPVAHVQAHFVDPWPANPLADLENI